MASLRDQNEQVIRSTYHRQWRVHMTCIEVLGRRFPSGPSRALTCPALRGINEWGYHSCYGQVDASRWEGNEGRPQRQDLLATERYRWLKYSADCAAPRTIWYQSRSNEKHRFGAQVGVLNNIGALDVMHAASPIH